MVTCEKCWRDSMGSSEQYQRLIEERDCTPEEQAGPDRTWCPNCHRRAVHQHVPVCMACDWEGKPERPEQRGEGEKP